MALFGIQANIRRQRFLGKGGGWLLWLWACLQMLPKSEKIRSGILVKEYCTIILRKFLKEILYVQNSVIVYPMATVKVNFEYTIEQVGGNMWQVKTYESRCMKWT